MVVSSIGRIIRALRTSMSGFGKRMGRLTPKKRRWVYISACQEAAPFADADGAI
jgi:hypothetical protein